MPQRDTSSASRRRPGGLTGRITAMLRPRPRLRLLPLARLADGSRVPTEGAVRALAATTPLSGRLLLCRTLGRYKMLLDAADLTLTPHLALDGFWEWWTTAFLARNLRPGETMIDAGASSGYFTLLAADLVGPTGRVVAIEPNPASLTLLRRNAALNGFGAWVTVEEAALGGNSADLLRLVVPEGSPMDAHVVPLDPAHGGRNASPVRARTLDEFAALQPDLIKLDIGGAEEAAWDGMQQLLVERPALRLLVTFRPAHCAEPMEFLERMAGRFPLRRLGPDGNAQRCTAAEALAGGDSMLYLAGPDPA